MKKGTILGLGLVVLLGLGGCAGQAPVSWETVGDDIPVLATESKLLYQITFNQPGDAVRETIGGIDGPLFYTGEQGDYEIIAQRLEADSIETVVKSITGFRLDQLSPVRQKEFDMVRYDFSWATTDEEGERICRAAVLDDGGVYYAVTFSVEEKSAKDCAEKMESVFSTIGLQTEGNDSV